MKRAGFPIVLIMTALLLSCNNDRNRSGARQQLLIPRQNTQYDSTLLSPTYANKRTPDQNTGLSQSSITPIDALAAQALAAGRQNPGQPLDTAAILLARGLNPPHGAPGHRCDIVVGAPLNTKPATNTTQSSIVPINNTSNNAALNNGLNPAHGLPGHRCDIAVGAPLNSKPVTTVTNQNIPVVTNNSIATDSNKVDSVKN